MKRIALLPALALILLASVNATALDLGTHNTNVNTNVNAAAAAAAASARQRQSQGQFQGQGQTQRATAKQSQGNSNTIEGDQNPRQAPSFAAPSLVASNEACMGSTSSGAGVSAGAVGISAVFGTTWQAQDCERRMYAQQLRLAGNNAAALALMALNPEVAQALRTAGYTGPLPGPVAAAPLSPAQQQAHAAATPGGDQHPACAPSSWATREWRAANCR